MGSIYQHDDEALATLTRESEEVTCHTSDSHGQINKTVKTIRPDK